MCNVTAASSDTTHAVEVQGKLDNLNLQRKKMAALIRLKAAKANRDVKKNGSDKNGDLSEAEEDQEEDQSQNEEGEEEMLNDRESNPDKDALNSLWNNPTALFEVELQQSQVIFAS